MPFQYNNAARNFLITLSVTNLKANIDWDTTANTVYREHPVFFSDHVFKVQLKNR